MRESHSSISDPVQTITVPPGPLKSLRNRGRAVFSASGFTVIIQRSDSRLPIATEEDGRLWSRIEKSYRATRKNLIKERYPYLYGG